VNYSFNTSGTSRRGEQKDMDPFHICIRQYAVPLISVFACNV